MKKLQYDVFISYRRDAYESANLVATRLKAEGYRVFFDLETMRAGKFNEQLYSVIDDCKDFILVLSPDALNRCFNEDDWVRKEIQHAMQYGKNIVPILLAGFQWPERLPEALDGLQMYQSVAASKEFFDLAMQRLQGYLKSRRFSRRRRVIKWTLGLSLSTITLYLVAEVVFRFMSVPACIALVDHMTMQMCSADILLDNNSQMRDAIKGYEQGGSEDVIFTLNYVESELGRMESMNADDKLIVTEFHDFLLSIYEMGAGNRLQYEEYFNSFFSDQRDNIDYIWSSISSGHLLPSARQSILDVLDVFEHNVNSLFISYISVLNDMPEKSLNSYHSLAEHWEHLPKVGLGYRNAEYEKFIERELNLADKNLNDMQHQVLIAEDSLAMALEEIETLHRTQLQQYQRYLTENTIASKDDVGVNWGRIILMAGYLEVAVAIEEEYVEGDPVHPVTSELVLNDLKGMLRNFASLYPDYLPAVNSVEVFYREVAEGRRPLEGVLISIFALGKSHDVYNQGDIIIAWNGVKVKNLSELINANHMAEGNGKVCLLRLKNNCLVEIEIPIPGNEDIVGFSDLIHDSYAGI